MAVESIWAKAASDEVIELVPVAGVRSRALENELFDMRGKRDLISLRYDAVMSLIGQLDDLDAAVGDVVSVVPKPAIQHVVVAAGMELVVAFPTFKSGIAVGLEVVVETVADHLGTEYGEQLLDIVGQRHLAARQVDCVIAAPERLGDLVARVGPIDIIAIVADRGIGLAIAARGKLVRARAADQEILAIAAPQKVLSRIAVELVVAAEQRFQRRNARGEGVCISAHVDDRLIDGLAIGARALHCFHKAAEQLAVEDDEAAVGLRQCSVRVGANDDGLVDRQ